MIGRLSESFSLIPDRVMRLKIRQRRRQANDQTLIDEIFDYQPTKSESDLVRIAIGVEAVNAKVVVLERFLDKLEYDYRMHLYLVQTRRM